MLVYFWLLGAFFSLLAGFWELVGCLLLVLVVFFACWVAPGPILERPGSILEGPIPHFPKLFRARWPLMRKILGCAKTKIFPRFLHGFFASQALCSSRKTMQNRSRSLSNGTSCKDCAKNASWGGFWEGLAFSWTSLGRCWFALERLLIALGCSVGVF